jgi:hypothetical protein
MPRKEALFIAGIDRAPLPSILCVVAPADR